MMINRCLQMIFLSGVFSMIALSVSAQSAKRSVISLDGTWQIAEGNMQDVPVDFSRSVPVPGLVSLAEPAFRDAAPKVKDRNSIAQSDPLRKAFWYRRAFNIETPVPGNAVLKLFKAKYGTKVFLNGNDLGEHLPCFTPGYFDAKKFLKTGTNELIVRVGADRDAVPDSIPDGFDFEKQRYIPGIYDHVQLVLSGDPHIVRVQTAPDLVNKELQVQLVLSSPEEKKSDISFLIREAKSKKIVGTLKEPVKLAGGEKEQTIIVRIPVKDCHLWSPEDPFLYELVATTDGDEKEVTFGMREFHFDPGTRQAVLNGKPYYLRGTNITIYRFFEDSACGKLPWDTAWVRNFFKSLKQFHWNSIRFCVGLPPAFWYQAADEEGFLIQDEFPIWYGDKFPKEITVDELTREYTEMMYEDWNHPSVVIWDATNETIASANKDESDLTGQAVWKVRNLDLSNRPWDNGYETHRAPGDVYEAHPYHFMDPNFKLKDIANASLIAGGNTAPNLDNFPVIINEYGWLWLNRDGSLPTLTKELYTNLLGPNSTARQRWHLYATYLAAETEFWRCNGKSAGVMVFTALGYSRPDGQTSDFFTDPARLIYDSSILKYLPDAFAPVGLMLNEWGKEIACGKPHDYKIWAVNDLGKDWAGKIVLKILQDDKVVVQKTVQAIIPAYGRKPFTITVTAPAKPGKYTVEAVLLKNGEKPIKSIREEIPFVVNNEVSGEGWQKLFNGKDLSGWRGYQNKSIEAWSVEDGALFCDGHKKDAAHTDLITDKEYKNFILTLKWKIAPASNSGIMFHVTEDQPATFHSGPEYQIIDDKGWPAKLEPWQTTGSDYGTLAPEFAKVNPAGEWNTAKIVVNGAHVEHWLNGERILQYELWSPEWEKEKLKNWKDVPSYGMSNTGHIAFQYHGGNAWFKDIQIKPL